MADDHPIVLAGVREVIERDARFAVVGEAYNSSELVRLCVECGPDIVVTDYNMPGDLTYGDGLKLIDYLLRHFPQTRILILTMLSNNLILTSLYDLGVSGVVLKNGDLNEILVALAALSRGRTYRGPGMRSGSSVAPCEDDVGARLASLSVKEFEVLRHFVSGMSVGEIAVHLKRSVKTVSAQKIAAMRKLDVDSDQALVLFCIKANLFQ
ncbi:Transcriptional regulatory protein RcsB [compost metagenome]|uniref:Two-component system, NarL family, captular synthesis response regulator RcsB n=1 Tax=Pseudomonas jinjuensis TaxID=198616 RepID=A0A1H0NX45_9PSED|nr:two-component system, NarL family, captular synthesis response regulator RcsB [Pseudomonas jinjuensis]